MFYVKHFTEAIMNIALFGVSNVGKTVIGRLLAKKLEYSFYDLDEEVKKHMKVTLEEFVKTGSLLYRDQIRCKLIDNLTKKQDNKVLAITPLSHIKSIRYLFSSEDTLAIYLQDTAENIFERLVFSDENDCVYEDNEYKNANRLYYLSDIQDDLFWYGMVFSEIKNIFNMEGNSPDVVVDEIIKRYHLL
jgi:shikimate kinase